MPADNVKAQTVRNKWDEHIAKPIIEMERVVGLIRAAILNNSLGSEFSTAQKAAMVAVEVSVGDLVGMVGITQSAAQVVPTHRGQAIVIEGVND